MRIKALGDLKNDIEFTVKQVKKVLVPPVTALKNE
jgi:hypothetical protein